MSSELRCWWKVLDLWMWKCVKARDEEAAELTNVAQNTFYLKGLNTSPFPVKQVLSMSAWMQEMKRRTAEQILIKLDIAKYK